MTIYVPLKLEKQAGGVLLFYQMDVWVNLWVTENQRQKKALSINYLRLEFGADTRSRTEDLLITSQLLYQLSYAGITGQDIRGTRCFRQPLFD